MEFFKKKAVAAVQENDASVDAEAIMKKFDRESNTRIYDGIPRYIVRYLLVFFALYSFYINLLANWETRIERASFVGMIVFLVFLIFPAKKGAVKVNYIPWYDIALGLFGGASYFYFVFNCKDIISRGIALRPFEVVIAVIGILITLEACRRAVGIPIVVVSGAFIIYALTQKSLALNAYNLFYTTEGVIGTPIRACSTFIVLFVIFGAFLEKTGVANFFIELANSLVGGFSGGPAKAAVVASALEGMVSGSSVGNTVGSGSVTIPLMKKLGYKPEFAGAVEAAASTGGQIMPPIMGAAAFLMVEYTPAEFDYAQIALRAILPAFLYFAGIFITVHLEAKKLGLRGLSKEEIPDFLKIFIAKGYLLLPLIVLVVLLMRVTMSYAACIATLVAIAVSMFRKDTRLNLTRFFDALEAGAKGTLTVGVACAVAGIIACVITTTGIGTQLINLIVSVSGGNTFVALFLTMITCIVLGMGVPTTANYVIMATTCAPILIKLGIHPLAAHMFVFYFGIVADITPPVALAAYAGAAIGKANPMKTALNASKLAIAAFIVPYIFALNPAMIFIDTNVFDVILIVITSTVGLFGVAAGIEGYQIKRMTVIERILSVVGGLLMIYPGIVTDIIGIAIVAIVILMQVLSGKSKTLEA